MLVGVCTIELFLPHSASLKDKRIVLNSIKKRIRNKFNVSISEVDNTDKWQRVSLGVAVVTNERRFIDMTVSEILKFISGEVEIEILQHLVEIY
ncbi:MAG TPA: DUF503 domain-containing protein [bacterium]